MCGVCCVGWGVFVLVVTASYLVVWMWVYCIWWVVMICGVVVILMLRCSLCLRRSGVLNLWRPLWGV